jgi:hypothetical protein
MCRELLLHMMRKGSGARYWALGYKTLWQVKEVKPLIKIRAIAETEGGANVSEQS